jgi:5,10-methylenetetrahydromethanopterin reductase
VGAVVAPGLHPGATDFLPRPSLPASTARRAGRSETPSTGVWLFPDAESASIVAATRRAEDLGLDEFWLGDEGPARDPFALLAAAAAVTSRIRLGVAVTNPYLRHPVSTAVAAMTIHELSGGRAMLGYGPGGSLALDPVGIARERPLERTREAVRLVRAVSRGEATEGFVPPAHPFTAPTLPIWIGARGEGFNRYASAAVDGAFIGGVPLPAHELAIAWARSVRPIPIALYVNAVFDPMLAEQVRPRLVFALLDAPAAFRERLGVDRGDAQRAVDAMAAGDAGPARALVNDQRFDALSLRGTPQEVGRRLAGLVRTHAPTSIGVALLGHDPVAALDPVATAFASMTEVLAWASA